MSRIITNAAGTTLSVSPDGKSLVTDANGAPCCCGPNAPPGPPPPPDTGTGRFVSLRPCGDGASPCGPMYFDRLGASTNLGRVVMVLCGDVSVCACFSGSSDTRPTGTEVTIGDGFDSCCACVHAKAIAEQRDSPCCPTIKYLVNNAGQTAQTTRCCCAVPASVTMTGTYRVHQTNPQGIGTGIVDEVVSLDIRNAMVVQSSPCSAEIRFDAIGTRTQQTWNGATVTLDEVYEGLRLFWHCGDGVQVKERFGTDETTGVQLTNAATDTNPNLWPYPIGNIDDMTLRRQGWTGTYNEAGGCMFFNYQQAIRFDGANNIVLTQTAALSVTLNGPNHSECYGCFGATAQASGCAGCGASLEGATPL